MYGVGPVAPNICNTYLIKLFAQAKVCEHYVPAGVHEDVLQLQVSVDYPQLENSQAITRLDYDNVESAARNSSRKYFTGRFPQTQIKHSPGLKSMVNLQWNSFLVQDYA